MDFKNIFNLPKIETPNINPEIFTDFRDPDEVTNNILAFLKDQSKIAERQFKTSRNLILATIIIMLLQVSYAFWTSFESNSKQNHLTKIIEKQSQQSEVISVISLNLIDIQNQMHNLEQENILLKEKKTE